MRLMRYLHRILGAALIMTAIGLGWFGAGWIGLLTFAIGATAWAVGEALFRQ